MDAGNVAGAFAERGMGGIATAVTRVDGARVAAAGERLERAGASLARWGVVFVLAWIGATKFTAAEARGIVALVEHSPLMAWMYELLSVQAASNVIGVAELVAAGLLALRHRAPRAAVAGAALAVATFVVTLSFIATTPGAIDLSHGLPLPGGAAQFLAKDLALLGASVWALGDALRGAARDM